MKKFLGIGIVAAAIIVGAMACSAEKTTNEGSLSVTENKQEETKDPTEDKTDAVTDAVTDETQADNVQQPESSEPTGTSCVVYYGNSDADGFEKETVPLADLNPEGVLSCLITKGVVPSDTTVVGFTQSTVEGAEVIDLDLSENFGTYMNMQGTSGEYITIGSVCNTFLDAYGAEKIHVTVNGELLSTGHAEYAGYMSRFQ